MTLISGDPPILHSYLVESCCFTSLEESSFLINLGGSGKPKVKMMFETVLNLWINREICNRKCKVWGFMKRF